MLKERAQSEEEMNKIRAGFVVLEEGHKNLSINYDKIIFKYNNLNIKNKNNKIIINKLQQQNSRQQELIEHLRTSLTKENEQLEVNKRPRAPPIRSVGIFPRPVVESDKSLIVKRPSGQLMRSVGISPRPVVESDKSLITKRSFGPLMRSVGISPRPFVNSDKSLKQKFNLFKKFNVSLRYQISDLKKSKIMLEKSYREVIINNRSLKTQLCIFRERWDFTIKTKLINKPTEKVIPPKKKNSKLVKIIPPKSLAPKKSDSETLNEKIKKLQMKLKNNEKLKKELQKRLETKAKDCGKSREIAKQLRAQLSENKKSIKILENKNKDLEDRIDQFVRDQARVKSWNDSLRVSLKVVREELEGERQRNQHAQRQLDNLGDLVESYESNYKEIVRLAHSNDNEQRVQQLSHELNTSKYRINQYTTFIQNLFGYFDTKIPAKPLNCFHQSVTLGDDVINQKAMKILGMSEAEYYAFVSPTVFNNSDNSAFLEDACAIMNSNVGESIVKSLWSLAMNAFDELNKL